MVTCLKTLVFLLVATGLTEGAPSHGNTRHGNNGPPKEASRADAAYEDAVAAQPKILRISGQFDGSGRIIFTRKSVQYVHKHWGRPSRVLFDGEPWTKLDRTPAAWRELGGRLDLTKARIVRREGRDAIALEHTPDGIELYICDSPNGAAHYVVTLAIPRRN